MRVRRRSVDRNTLGRGRLFMNKKLVFVLSAAALVAIGGAARAGLNFGSLEVVISNPSPGTTKAAGSLGGVFRSRDGSQFLSCSTTSTKTTTSAQCDAQDSLGHHVMCWS